MITNEEVKKLAELARISLTAEETTELKIDLESILAYVSELSAVDVSGVGRESLDYSHRNVLRSDDVRFAPDQWTDKLLSQAPEKTGRHWAVKKILDQNFDA